MNMRDFDTYQVKRNLIKAKKQLRMKFEVSERGLGGEETRSIERDQGRMRENRAKMYIKKIINLNGSRGVVI